MTSSVAACRAGRSPVRPGTIACALDTASFKVSSRIPPADASTPLKVGDTEEAMSYEP